jgi:predicted CoA-binding protein
MTSASAVETFPKLRCWAVVGVSDDRSKYGNKIFLSLRDAGYRVYAINPKLTEVEGAPCYASVRELPEVPDVVDMVVPPKVGEQVVSDCIAAGVKRIWFQPGSESPEAIQKAQQAGLEVVHDACILIQKQDWDE